MKQIDEQKLLVDLHMKVFASKFLFATRRPNDEKSGHIPGMFIYVTKIKFHLSDKMIDQIDNKSHILKSVVDRSDIIMG